MPLAMALAGSGRRTAVIERKAVGGTCINYGCTPTKTLIHIAKVAEVVRRSAEYGVRSSAPQVDMLKVREIKRSIVSEFSQASEASLKATENLDLIFGHASFTGPRRLQVETREGTLREIEAPLVFVNVGTRAFIPSIPGLDSVRYLDNVSAMELDHLPETLTVLGAGYIGLELGQMFARLGSKVTILEQGDRFLPREDRDVAEEVLSILRDDGIELRLGQRVERFSSLGGRIVAHTADSEIASDELLVAVGRTPNTDDLGLALAGIETDPHGYIKADPRLGTTADGVYVIGDAKGGPAFTHISYDDYRVLKANLIDGRDRTIEGRPLPYVVFIDPQLAHIGITEEEARQNGVPYRLLKMPMSFVARAEEMNETRGFVKALIDNDTGRILGATVLGVEGGEIMAMIELALLGGLTARDLNDMIFAHPTLAELLNNLFAL
jgi:pyruvate/2-oxoglutarate dehydrogenase complex dihydrolipoamide dehydrogenase (E3) component